MAAACLAFAIIRLHRFPKLDVRDAGNPGKLQLISTLEAAGRAEQLHRSLPHLRGWLLEVAGTLRRRWPDSDVDLAPMHPTHQNCRSRRCAPGNAYRLTVSV
jgi:hypothetical protein